MITVQKAYLIQKLTLIKDNSILIHQVYRIMYHRIMAALRRSET